MRQSVITAPLQSTVFGVTPIVTATFAITWSDGLVWTCKKLNTRRPSGCRYQVFDAAGGLLFDTLDCFDFGNAVSALDDWLSAQRFGHGVWDVKKETAACTAGGE